MTLCGVDMLALWGEMGHSVYHLLQAVYTLWKICLQKEGLAAEIKKKLRTTGSVAPLYS